MKAVRVAAVAVILLVGAVVAALIVRSEQPRGGEDVHAEEDHGGGHGAGAEAEKGPHGGRMLRENGFAAEVALVERGGTAELRLYAYDDGRPIDPSEVSAQVMLERFGGEVERVALKPEEGSLAGDGTVEEPHSFVVTVNVGWRGRAYAWTYESFEDRVELSAEAAERSGIEVETAGPVTLETRLRLNGRIVPNEDRLAHVLPRFSGIVREVRKHVGDAVAKGEVMAIVQSNQSLQPYEVRSEIGGTVTQKHVTPGEYVSEGDHLYTVADLGTVWIDLDVYRQDFPRVAVGQPVVLDQGAGMPQAEGRIGYIPPFGSATSQTLRARVVLPNPDLAWRPGLFVTGEVVVDRARVPLAVRTEALQTLRDRSVVFLQDGEVYQAQPVELGRRDAQWVEILSGIEPGQRYVARHSFVLKADVGKSGASHDH